MANIKGTLGNDTLYGTQLDDHFFASYGDDTGGPYLYARDAFGPRAGFIVVWMCFVNALFSFAAVASAAAGADGATEAITAGGGTMVGRLVS